ncbi:MAG: serine metalloprotease, partial [Legionella longbeachae]|nr:serine metalloprotease [Legionella longbeachae]
MFKSGILSLSLLSISHGVFAAADQDTVRVIIKYKEGPKNITFLKSRMKQLTQLPVKQMNPMANGAYLLILDSANSNLTKGGEDTSAEVLKRLNHNPQVLYAVKDRVSYFKPVPDPEVLDSGNILSHESQWDEFTRPAGIMLESKPGFRDGAWAYTTGLSKNPIVVAVLDTGIALNGSLMNNLVKDSAGNIWGWNFAANNNNLLD